jgi:SAM-dependent methyltransferase
LLACYARAPIGHWGTDEKVSEVRFYGAKKRLLEKFSTGKRVLDFGCFDGGFLTYLGAGYEKFGIEPAAEPARIAEQRGVNVLGPTVAAAIEMAMAAPLPPVDAIIAFDVFEHLNDPVATLRDLRRLLKPGGVVLIETGDTDAPAFKRVGIRYGYAALVEHVGLFNRRSIEEAGRQAGLTLVHFQRSLHHVTAWPARITYELRNAVWHVLRAIDGTRLPLPARLKQVARGHLPRMTRPDHFLAVLRVE